MAKNMKCEFYNTETIKKHVKILDKIAAILFIIVKKTFLFGSTPRS